MPTRYWTAFKERIRKEAHPMRAFRLCLSALLAAILGLTGCGPRAYVRKGPEKKSNFVTIKECVADPDTVRVAKGDTLTWKVDTLESSKYTYTIDFHSKKPIKNSTAPTGQGQTITGDTSCTLLGWIIPNNCLFPYDLVQQDISTHISTTCHDPGVHVGGGLSLRH